MTERQQMIKEAMAFRHACKKFDPDRKINDEDFETILQAAHLSPSSFGFEPWQVVVLENKEVKDRLYEVAWGARKSLEAADRFVLIFARKPEDTISSSDYITHIMEDVQHLDPEMAKARRALLGNFQQHDFKLLDTQEGLLAWATHQTYILLANMLSTAAFLQIDSCPIEGFDKEKVEQILAEEGILDTRHFGITLMAGFGYRGEEPHREKTRQPFSDVVLWK